uniref:CAAX prenyl protease n=1 Tax=Aplanochytrium stocchinoi TaxID=215587 RepID=A0A7S3LPG5_9STRA|mmetsp:Transcript_7439/g.8982  ORF Transcript_7439/g.8982 Transcript_7439/m.8982 type:complete len:432 (+) Transcript_7439:132-1427(+)
MDLSPCEEAGICPATIYLLVVLLGILFTFLLELVSDILTLKSLGSQVPEELDDIYDQDKYENSQSYNRARIRFGIISGLFDLLVTLVFWFVGGFGHLDDALRSVIDSEIGRGTVYIVILSTAENILSLPFSLYSTFVLEQRYGFNKTSAKTYVLDLVKVVLLSVVLGIPVLAAVLAFFTFVGEFGWLYLYLFILIVNITLIFVSPMFILPLFFEMEPLEQGELRTAILALAEKADFDMKDIFVIDGSKRSSHSNAFFTGFGPSKRICLFDTLISQQSTDEIVAVLGHEIGHYKKGHIYIGMVLSFLETFLMLYLLSIFISNPDLAAAFYVSEPSAYFGLIAFGMLLTPIQTVLGVVGNIISRMNEYSADKYGAELTGKPKDLILSLKKLSKDNLSNLTPHPFSVFIGYSHPPVLMRVRALNDLESHDSTLV